MKERTLKAVCIIAVVVAIIGLLSFIGDIRTVNLGAFVFPAMIAVGAFIAYKKK